MNNKFTKIFAGLLFFTCISISSKAQKISFVITANGDTLAGQIIGESISRFKFKSQTDTKFQKFTASQVEEYRKDEKQYFSKILPGEVEPVFVERLQHGAIDLFRYYKSTGSYNPTGAISNSAILKWYASKNNGALLELKANWNGSTSRKQRKENFEALISDNAIIMAQYKTGNSFEFDFLERLIKRYNTAAVVSEKQ